MKAIYLTAALALLVACGGSDSAPPDEPGPPAPASESSAAEQPTPEAPEAPEAAATSDPEVVRPDADGVVRISGSDQLRFDVTRFEVRSGETVRIEFRNAGQQPKAVMAHNLVVLQAGVDVDAFAIEALQLAGSDYLPEGDDERILAATRLLGPQESDRIEFEAPAPGTYTFVCTFPGHYTLMQGVMVVL